MSGACRCSTSASNSRMAAVAFCASAAQSCKPVTCVLGGTVQCEQSSGRQYASPVPPCIYHAGVRPAHTQPHLEHQSLQAPCPPVQRHWVGPSGIICSQLRRVGVEGKALQGGVNGWVAWVRQCA